MRIDSNMIKLYEEKKRCCGCAACASICPVAAIEMWEDEYGFVYPHVNSDLCVECHRCESVCRFQKNLAMNCPIEAYAACSREEKILSNSASGGAFGAIALAFIEQKGVVYGTGITKQPGYFAPVHRRIEKAEDIHILQGSKYVQSEIGDIYKSVKKDLLSGKNVLFSGTPCQVEGLKGYLGKTYESLLTIDIICHGVPSAKMFMDYIRNLEKYKKIQITDFRFRDKIQGWGKWGSYNYRDENGIEEKMLLNAEDSSFYQLFLGSDICRENCYFCKYAKIDRCSDITIGDYWGIEREHPEYLSVNGGEIDPNKGISCLLVNSQAGKYWLHNRLIKWLKLYPSDIDKVKRGNKQLNSPSTKGKFRKKILKKYIRGGYSSVEKFWEKNLQINNRKLIVKRLIKIWMRIDKK